MSDKDFSGPPPMTQPTQPQGPGIYNTTQSTALTNATAKMSRNLLANIPVSSLMIRL